MTVLMVQWWRGNISTVGQFTFSRKVSWGNNYLC